MRSRIIYIGSEVFLSSSDKGGATIYTRDLAGLRAALGPQILAALCQCFYGVDHLRSILSFMQLNSDHEDDKSVSHARNLSTVIFMLCGVVREISIVLLRLGERERGLERFPSWEPLAAIADRCGRRTSAFRILRDKFAFHFDDLEMMTEGLERLCDARELVTIMEATPAATNPNGRDVLGLAALLRGVEMEEKEFTGFVEQASADAVALIVHVESLFVEMARSPLGPKSPAT